MNEEPPPPEGVWPNVRSTKLGPIGTDSKPDLPAAVVLAAGKGTRFGSPLPKVLQPIAGRPLLGHVLLALDRAGIGRTVLVVGFGADQVTEAYPALDQVIQEEQLGTGHALLQARGAFGGTEEIVVVYGDVPLIDPELIRTLVAARREQDAVMAALTCDRGDVTGMGRVVRDAAGRPLRIVEEKAATSEERLISEWNCGFYSFDGAWLWHQLGGLKPSRSGEVYLTDLFELAARSGRLATVTCHDPVPVSGVNDRDELARVEAIVRERVRLQLLRSGVSLVSPETIVIDVDVSIGWDTRVLPGTVLLNGTAIGERCKIGPHAILDNCRVGDDCLIGPACLVGEAIESGATVLPYTSTAARGRAS